ncbi:sigma-54 dependent dna-binding response regulator [hydrocarbon metagenome]|uniref:Sigma-54 dependent dna-binding response regulator n=1 Tax=hydrocarbon metagenome TaxID=938273 RepID=A0A0W8G3W6_9ZZZZ
MPDILIIDDDPEIRQTMAALAGRMDLTCDAAATLAQGLATLSGARFGVVLLDVGLPDGNGLTALPRIKALDDAPEVIILTGLGDPDGAELAIQAGVWDYLVKPASIKEIMLRLSRALAYREQKRQGQGPLALDLTGVVAESPAMRPCLDQAAAAAASQAAVLITGETGTGKELFARLIHHNSARAKGPFVVVDCAALTETLVESTLFGHKKGAFTGADADRTGLVAAANGGTLFLDEVGEMPLSLQKSFLRVLHERRFRPVGSLAETASDFRLVAATNRDLAGMIEAGTFRNDLYFRLKTISLELPPLRQRPEDVAPLTLYCLGRLGERYGMPHKGFDADFLAILQEYDWPGNVRELENVLERAFVAAGREKTLYPMHLPQDVRIRVTRRSLVRSRGHGPAPAGAPGAGEAPAGPVAPPSGPSDPVGPADPAAAATGALADGAAPLAGLFSRPLPSLRDFREDMERIYLRRLLAECGGDLKRAMEASGLSRSHFYALLKKIEEGETP